VFVVVVVGGMGSLLGAFMASLLLGLLQTFAVAADVSLAHVFVPLIRGAAFSQGVWALKLSQLAPVLPYLLLVLTLILRPQGLMGERSS
jgi:branched-chain amino acid transport system permease protein